MNKIDLTGHSPAVKDRPVRGSTDSILVHHIGIDIDRDGETTFEEVIEFFCRDPEGIATVVLGGTYASKRPTIERWRRDGVPAVYQGRGLVPYHFGIDRLGRAARFLPLNARGLHAAGYNDRSVAVAFLGDFKREPPTKAELDAGIAVIRDIRAVYPRTLILGHDETIVAAGGAPKGCPGAAFPLEEMRKLFA